MLSEIIHRTIGWLLTLEFISVVSSLLVSHGWPGWLASIFALAVLLGIVWKFENDRYFFSRWRRKIWRR